MEHEGYILIADITGYTVYLSESELDHAKGTLTELLELLIAHTRPPLVISRLEGDAVFSYGFREGFVNAQTFLETIEDTYVAFRRAIELMVLNNSCRCNACANVSTLDLKFFIHYGTFAVQQVGDQEELMGSDVNLIHRLLKNQVTAETGIRAYVLCTDAAERALGMTDDTQSVVPHTETVPDFGEVKVWIRDMHPVFERRRDEMKIEYSPDEIISTMETFVSMPPEILWDYVNQSRFRNLLLGSDRYVVEKRRAGRVGVGSAYQCYHGDKLISQTVLEWQPFERIVLSQTPPFPGKRPVTVHMDIRLEPDERGTRLTISLARLAGPTVKRMMFKLMTSIMNRRSRQELDEFRKAIQADFNESRSSRSDSVQLSPELIGAEAASSLESRE